MTTQAQATSVQSEIVVEAPLERAFAVFTEDIGSWWPPENHILEAELAEMVFEPRVGGHVYDRGVDGSECRWARVLAYEPPSRVVITWDITPQWQLETDSSRASEIEVRFVPEAPAHPRRAGAPQPRAPRRGLGRPPRRSRLRGWLGELPAELRRAHGDAPSVNVQPSRAARARLVGAVGR
jgi:uncharacterized protein YndB with AHSA1/START domain